MVVPLSAAPVKDGWRAVLFGKLPLHGDFVCRGMSDGERAAWDAWLSEGLAAAREALGDAFEPAHAAAPPWRFITGPGSFGDSWRAGCLAPSVDSAGRRFVIVLAAEGLDWADAAAYGPSLAEAFGETIYRIFAERLDADRAFEAASICASKTAPVLAQALAALSSPRADGVWWSEGGERHAPAFESGAAPDPGLLLVKILSPSEPERAPCST